MMAQRAGAIVNMSLGLAGGAAGHPPCRDQGGHHRPDAVVGPEAAPYNVRVNCVALGYIETDMFHQIPVLQRKKLLEASLRRPASRRRWRPWCGFSRRTTRRTQGQSIVVDGGLTPGCWKMITFGTTGHLKLIPHVSVRHARPRAGTRTGQARIGVKTITVNDCLLTGPVPFSFSDVCH